MKYWLSYFIAIFIFIFTIVLLTGCAEFPINAQQQQLNCEPAESDGCAGWLPPKED